MPTSYLKIAEIELNKGNKSVSKIYYDRAKLIADSTENRQAQVSSLCGIANWILTFEKNDNEAEEAYQKAKIISLTLNDKSFYQHTLEAFLALKKKQGNFHEALIYEEEIAAIKDSLNNFDKEKAIKSLEIQFEVSEKDRLLKVAQKEKDITLITNYLLWVSIAFTILISLIIIFFLKRNNKRDQLLLKAKSDLVTAIEEQKKLKELQLRNDLEFKESQLSAMTLQMLQKNELMQELKENVDQDGNNSISKIITKGLNHDKEWSDFNTSFESLNKNFYTRLKQEYPEISPNDLKICALIKLNLSIKEMAGILNVSPDSVKTARYRLRKKLQLNTEDNLTDFILKL